MGYYAQSPDEVLSTLNKLKMVEFGTFFEIFHLYPPSTLFM